LREDNGVGIFYVYLVLSFSRFSQIVCASALALLACIPALGAEPAGQVLFAAGSPTAVAADGTARPLRKGDAVEEGDLLVTGDGRLQIVFKDHGVAALYPDTEFRVERYRYTKAGDDSDGVVLSLLKGGLRTISGLVGKSNRSDYRMQARVATIGIRGTEYGLQLGETLVGNVGEGAIDVCNSAGCLRVGVSQAFMVPSLTEMPVLAQLQARLLSPAAGQDSAPHERDDDAGREKNAPAAVSGTGHGHADKEKHEAGTLSAAVDRGASEANERAKQAAGATRGKRKYFRDEDLVDRGILKRTGSAEAPELAGASTSAIGALGPAGASGANAGAPSSQGGGSAAASPGTPGGAPGATLQSAGGLVGAGVATVNPPSAAPAPSVSPPAAALPRGLAKKLTDPLAMPPGLLKKLN
jgi:hypothetical protein